METPGAAAGEGGACGGGAPVRAPVCSGTSARARQGASGFPQPCLCRGARVLGAGSERLPSVSARTGPLRRGAARTRTPAGQGTRHAWEWGVARKHRGPYRQHPVAGRLARRCLARLSAAGGRASAVALLGRSLWPAPGGCAYTGPDCPVREAEEQGAWGSGAEAAGTGPPPPSGPQLNRRVSA